jgi:hypothetical protein
MIEDIGIECNHIVAISLNDVDIGRSEILVKSRDIGLSGGETGSLIDIKERFHARGRGLRDEREELVGRG